MSENGQCNNNLMLSLKSNSEFVKLNNAFLRTNPEANAYVDT